MTAFEQQPLNGLRRYWAVLRRRWPAVLAFAVVVPAIAIVLAANEPNKYEARSTVLVGRQSIANQLAGATDVGLQQQSFQQVLLTQARLARTPTVLRDALAKSGPAGAGLTTDQLEADSQVEASPETDLIVFRVTRKDANAAKRLSISYANAYVMYRRELDSTALTKALAELNSAIADARARGEGGQGLVDRLSTSRQELETRLALQAANAQVVAGPADAPKVSPRPFRSGLVGLVLGLLLGIIAAAVRETFDTRVRTSSEVEVALGLPILSRLPRSSEKVGAQPTLTMMSAPHGAAAEGFRILRTNLAFGVRSHHAKVVMVTSATQGEGKSTTIANLAVAWALAGQRVALVDLDLRRPRVAALFNVGNTAGITGVAIGDATLEGALIEVDLAAAASSPLRSEGSLSVLPSGALPPDPGEFVSSDGISRSILELREQFDLVLIDAPPIVSVSDTLHLASTADALFVCVRLGVVRRPMLTELKRALERVSVPVLGQVVTGDAAGEESYTGYYGYAAEPTVARTE